MPPSTSVTGCSRYSKDVTTPKLPPPPRSAQNRSGMFGRAGRAELAVGRDDIGREQVVDRQARACPSASPGRRRASARRCRCWTRCRRSWRVRTPASRGRTRARAHRPAARTVRLCGIDADALHRRQVDDQAAVVGAIAGRAVAAAAHRQRQVVRSREIHRPLDVGDAAQRAISAGRRSMLPFHTRRACS